MAGSTAAPRRLRTYTRPRVSLLYVLRRTLHRLFELQVWDVAAAMTFFGALSLLPTVIALLSVVSLLGVEEETVDAAAHLAAEIWPSLTPDVVREWILTLGSAGPGTGAVVLGAVGTVVSLLLVSPPSNALSLLLPQEAFQNANLNTSLLSLRPLLAPHCPCLEDSSHQVMPTRPMSPVAHR